MKFIREIRYRLRGSTADWRAYEVLCDAMGAPRAWVVCPHCGAQDWRLPPHALQEPCPLVQETAQSLGLRFDAERMTALRTGTHLEAATQAMQRYFNPPEDEDAE